jgi:hypothetical protein
MCIAALEAMHYNRYWQANGGWLTDEQIATKNDLVDRAIYELLAPVVDDSVLDDQKPAYDAFADDCEDDMRPWVIYLGGNAYLADDCGCGTKYFRLTEVSPTIGDDGVVFGSADETDPGYLFDDVSDNLASCYAEKAVPYLLGRCRDFTETANSILEQGLDFVAGGFDEWLNLGALAIDLLGGDESDILAVLKGFDQSEIDDALTDETYVNTMIDLWTYTGPVSKQELRAWAQSGPSKVGDVTVRGLLDTWISSSLILGYNQQLEVYIAECKAGMTTSELPDLLLNDDGSRDYTWGVKTYRVYTIDMNDTNIKDAGVVPGAGVCDGLFVHWTAPSGGVLGRIRSTVCNWDQCSIAAGQTYMGTTLDSNMTPFMNDLIGQTFASYGSTQNAPFNPTGVQLTVGASLTVHTVWAVQDVT